MAMLGWLVPALLLIDPDVATVATARAALPAHLAALTERWRIEFSPEARPEGFGHAGTSGRVLTVYRLPVGRAAPGAEVRSVLFAWLAAADEAAGWSADPRWRALIRWSPWPGAGNLALPPARATSPRAALAASAADLLFPHGDKSLNSLTVSAADASLDCRNPARARLLRTLLELPPAHPVCPAFEAWARLDALVAIEINLASPSGVSVASLFGHVFLRLIYTDARGHTPATHSVAVAYLAEHDFSDDRFYALHGLVGSYAVRLFEVPFEQVYQGYVIDESRDIHRWRLVLSPSQKRALMERLWAAHQGEAWRYLFFTRNCASLLMDLLHDVLGDVVPTHPGLLGKSPGAALDALQRAGPLEPIDPPFQGRHTVARAAERTRQRLEPALLAARPGVAAVLADARGPPEQRARAYEALGQHADEAMIPWLRASLEVELALSPDGRLTPPLEALQAAQTHLRARLGDLPPVQVPEIKEEIGKWPHPGVDQLTLALLGPEPGLRLGVAGFEERLGDQRRHGVGGDVELILLQSRLDLDAHGLGASHNRLIGYRTIRPPLPGEVGLPGFGFALDGAHRGATRGVAAELSLLVPLAMTPQGAHHLVLGAGLAPGLQQRGALHPGLELPLDLIARWGLGGHALQARGRLRSGFGTTPTFGHQLTLTGRLGLWPEGPAGLGISLEADLEHSTASPIGLPTRPGLTTAIGLRFE